METNHRKIIILRGIPGSGKTTYAKSLVDKGFNRVNKDDIRHMINNYKLNNADEKIVHIIQEDIIKTLMFYGRNIVIDNTHAKQKYVDELIALIIKWNTTLNYEYEIVIKVIDVPLSVALERNSKRDNPVFEEVIKKMYKELKA